MINITKGPTAFANNKQTEVYKEGRQFLAFYLISNSMFIILCLNDVMMGLVVNFVSDYGYHSIKDMLYILFILPKYLFTLL